ncbi:MAG: radical SAM protein, partial [Candidatus Omnitrophica bacterium]|nr:radical SAM protein [Candidatus Omnitrophota bacterium]
MDKLYFQWHITNLCNFRCQHCYQDRFDDKEDLDWQRMKEVVDKIVQYAKEYKLKIVINLTGGEPFLKKEFFLLLNYLESIDQIQSLAIITNGSLLDEVRIDKLKKYYKLRQIKFSLEGAQSSINDKIRGEGSYDKVWKSIQLVKERTKILPLIMFTVLKSNLHQLPLLIELAKYRDIPGIIIERFFPLGRGKQMKEEVLKSDDWFFLNE